MKKPMILLALCLSLVWMAGCTAAPTLPTATITATPMLPTSTTTDTPMPPLPTEVQAMATTATSGPTPEWTFAAGGPIRSPITVTDGVVYFGSEDHYLYAVNIATHDLMWKFKTDGAIRSQPAVSKDMVYTTSDDSYLYAVSKSDGSLSWKSQVEKEVVERTQLVAVGADWDWYTSAPILQDATLYIGGTDGNLYALDAATGKTLWKYATIKMSAIRTTPLVAAGVVYFGDTAGNFYAIDAQKGIKLWNYTTTYSNHDNGLVLVDNVLYFGTDMGFFALDAKTGNVKWKILTNGYFAFIDIPAYENGILYMDGYEWNPIGAYSIAQDGARLWLAPANDVLCIASPAIGKNTIYYGCDSLGFFAVDKQTGVIKWSLPVTAATGSGVNSSPTVVDGVVYFGGMDGKLYAIKDQ